jgi:archaellum component FlaC
VTDDIVIRLREYNPVKGFIDWHDTMTTAANEIEDLRAELKEFSSQYQQLKRELETYKDLYAREAVERAEQNG